MKITRHMAMAEMVHLNYLLLHLLPRFNIRLGFGNKTVEQVCAEHTINTDFFLEIVNSFHDRDFFPEKDLQTFGVDLTINYLRKTHEYYIFEKLPQIEKLVDHLIASLESNDIRHISLIKEFFEEYRRELIAHIEREEKVAMPYMLRVNNAYINRVNFDETVGEIREHPLDMVEDEHSNMEDKLYDLKNLIIKYIPPLKDVNTCNTLLIELFRLEKDLDNHAHIEDRVLIPKVKMMEKELLKGVKK